LNGSNSNSIRSRKGNYENNNNSEEEYENNNNVNLNNGIYDQRGNFQSSNQRNRFASDSEQSNYLDSYNNNNNNNISQPVYSKPIIPNHINNQNNNSNQNNQSNNNNNNSNNSTNNNNNQNEFYYFSQQNFEFLIRQMNLDAVEKMIPWKWPNLDPAFDSNLPIRMAAKVGNLHVLRYIVEKLSRFFPKINPV